VDEEGIEEGEMGGGGKGWKSLHTVGEEKTVVIILTRGEKKALGRRKEFTRGVGSEG